MKATSMMTLLATTSLALSTQALTLSVKDVKIAQRYPWNGLVDIDYTVECSDPDANVYIYPTGYDKDYNQTMPLWIQYLSGEGVTNAVKAGTHRMTWDMAKQMGVGYNRAAFSVKLNAYAGAAPYMVIDLSAGATAEKYSISYLDVMPGTTWPAEYLMNKIVLKLIPAGTFTMGNAAFSRYNSSYCGLETVHEVTLTQPFYMAVYELTWQQYSLITGSSFSGNASSAATGLSYNFLRGSTLGAQWPVNRQVEADSLIGKLRARTGITFDLPTEAQWEYACKAGTSAEKAYTAPSPNGFGLYYMSAQPAEWCLDWFMDNLGTAPATDPAGPASGSSRMIRGGFGASYTSSNYTIGNWASARGYRWYDYTYPSRTSDSSTSFGCRLVAIPGDGTK